MMRAVRTSTRRFALGLVTAGLLAAALAVPASGGPEDTQLQYTLLGRGYATVFGYPLDEVPGGGDDEEPAEEPPPDQTCPEDQQGIDEATQAELDAMTDLSGLEPLTAEANEVPTPFGQPIKFDLGLADTSLRSDPGSHAIASFFYVDLGGGQDPMTTAEADGFAIGTPRMQERCARPWASQPGTASDVHVLARAGESPDALAYNHFKDVVLPGGGSFRQSMTFSEMTEVDGVSHARIVANVEGITLGPVTADSVTSVITFRSDGTAEGTEIKATVDVVGLTGGDDPLRLRSGAPPVAVGSALVGVAAPTARTLTDGTIEVVAGGLYVAGEFPNPLGLQSKQAVYLGGTWLIASASRVPTIPAPAAAPAPPPAPEPEPQPQARPAPASRQAPLTVAAPPAPHPEAQPEVAAPATQPVMATRTLGVYWRPREVAGPILIASGVGLAFLAAAYAAARRRFPGIADVPGLRLLDTAYRAFVGG